MCKIAAVIRFLGSFPYQTVSLSREATQSLYRCVSNTSTQTRWVSLDYWWQRAGSTYELLWKIRVFSFSVGTVHIKEMHRECILKIKSLHFMLWAPYPRVYEEYRLKMTTYLLARGSGSFWSSSCSWFNASNVQLSLYVAAAVTLTYVWDLALNAQLHSLPVVSWDSPSRKKSWL